MHNEARPGVWRGLHRGATPLRFPGDRPGFSPGFTRREQSESHDTTAPRVLSL
jgi:hypothetical protein